MERSRLHRRDRGREALLLDPLGPSDVLLLQAILDLSDDAIVWLGPHGTIKSWNRGAEQMFGYTKQEALDRIVQLLSPGDRDDEERELAAAVRSGRAVVGLETVRRRKDRTLVDVSVALSPVRGPGDEVRGAVLICRDITERKTLQNELAHQAFHDSLTGLANRALFRERVEHARGRETRSGLPFAVVLIDVDDFKLVNDSLGYAAGDVLLQQLADRLSIAVRPTDTVGRIGGDEFALLLEDVDDISGSLAAAERVSLALDPPFDIDGRKVHVSASFGVALSGQEVDASALLRNADVAMYSAKSHGGGVRAFEASMHAAAVRRLHLRSDLERAVEMEEFALHYQPIVNLTTGHISGVEALVRWEHPIRGLVAPADFIPLAEKSDLIVPLGRFVLSRATEQVARWHSAHPDRRLRVGVNVSTPQLNHPEFVSDVAAALERTGLDATSLVLELTESIFMEEDVAEVLHELKDLGVVLAIDDFGTGYSSLAYLEQLPIDILKIDRMFIRGFGRGPEDAAVARAVIRLAHAMSLQTVAEGVELSEQVARLRSLRCHHGQGFYFAKPLPPESLEAVLGAGSFGYEQLDEWQPPPRVVALPA